MGAIVFAGSRLSWYGDVIAQRTRLGRTWVGVALMASITSLPELVTGISSVAIFDLPNIAAGDVFGSCMFNLLLIALIDVLVEETPLSTRVQQGQVLTAAFGVLMLGTAGAGIIAAAKIPGLGWISLSSLVLLGMYFVAMRVVFMYEKKRAAQRIEQAVEAGPYDAISTSYAVRMYTLNALIVVAAAIWLPRLGAQIADITGLGRTFVGSVFVAVSTSLPELVVSLAALRIGAVDLVLGNLLGSNLFNIGILAVDDMFYRKGSLLEAVDKTHMIAVCTAMAMTAVAIIGITYRPAKKRHRLAWDSAAIAGLYAAASVLLYELR